MMCAAQEVLEYEALVPPVSGKPFFTPTLEPPGLLLYFYL